MFIHPSKTIALSTSVLITTVFLYPIIEFAQAPRSSQALGSTPKEALHPKMYAELSNQQISITTILDQHNKILAQNSSMLQDIAALKQGFQDLAHRLDIQRTDINSMQPEVFIVRLSNAEKQLAIYKEERDKEAVEAKASRDAMMSYIRGISGGVFTALISIGLNAYIAYRRDKKQVKSMSVLTAQTNGVTDHVARLSNFIGQAKGHADERAGVEQKELSPSEENK